MAHTANVLVTVSKGSTISVNVRIVSQPPVVDATVSVMVVAELNTCPFQVYGNWLAQIASVLVTVNSGSTVNVNVRMVSQPPVVDATVSVIVLAALNTCPFQVYGSWLAHTANVLVTVSNGSTVSVRVLIVSQPPVVLLTVSVIVDAELNTWPFQVYGSWLAQIASVLVTVSNGSTVSVSVLIVSQPPVVLATVSVIVDAELNTCPFQVYGSWFAHTANVLVTVNNGSTVSVRVRIVSQPPVVDATVSIMVVAELNT